MVLNFTKDERLFAPDLINLSRQLRFGVKTVASCLVTEKGVPDMSVDVAAGTVLFDATDVAVAGQNVAIAAAHASLDRIDVVVVNSAGTASVITGTPAATPKAPAYDASTYLALARVFVDDGTTTILNADITDIRIYNTGVGAGVQVQEQDGVPTVVNVNTIKVTNGSLTDDGGGVVSLETGVGGTNIYTEPFVGQTSLTVTHNLSDDRPIVQVYDSANEQITPDTIDITDSNNVAIEFAVATTGFVVVHGGTAELKSGGVGTYLHDQTVSSSAWSVTHNLNDSNPVVQVFDSTGDVIEPTSIDITGANTLTVNFGSNQTGKVRVLAGKFNGSVYQNVDLIPDTDDAYDIGSGAARWQDLFLSGNITVDGDILPETHNTSDFGTTGVRFKDGYFQGKLYVVGGIDPSYIQLDPQASEPDSGLSNKLWIDSSDSNKLKFKNNAGSNYEVVDFSHVGTGANDIVQLDGSGALPAVDGSNLTSVPALGVIPIGGVTAWLKSYPNTPALPAQFAECNGQTLSDGDSPYNGQTLPNLNGTDEASKKFLRGATTSGGAGNTYQHSHSWGSIGGVFADDGTPYHIADSSHIPPYYEVVWIIRIK